MREMLYLFMHFGHINNKQEIPTKIRWKNIVTFISDIIY